MDTSSQFEPDRQDPGTIIPLRVSVKATAAPRDAIHEAWRTGYDAGHSDALEREIDPGEGASKRPALVWADEIELNVADCGLIDGHMPRTGIGVSYGESGSGKTFVVLDRACHIAAGLPWRGMAVEQGVVIYIAAESPESVKRRVWAWKRHHGVSHLPLLIVQASVDLLNGSTAELVELVTKVRRGAWPRGDDRGRHSRPRHGRQ